MRSVSVSLLLASGAAVLCGTSPASAAAVRGALLEPARAAPQFSVAPTLVPNGNPSAPLAARIFAQTDLPAMLHLEIDDGFDIWTLTPVREFRVDHELPVLGLAPNRVHTITVFAVGQFGEWAVSDPLTFWTPGLPPIFPPIDTVVSSPALMEPGVTLMNVMLRTHPAVDAEDWGLLVALDAEGQLRWYYNPRHQISDVRRLSNGNLLYIAGRQRIIEIDMFGEVQAHWWAAGLSKEGAPEGAVHVATDSFHHEVFELPDSLPGDFVVLSSELRVYPDYPADESDLSVLSDETNVVGDVVVEFRRDGSIVRQWSLLDVLDPYRISYDSLGGFWDDHYGVPTADWSHANAVILDQEHNGWILSLRSQDAVIRLNRSLMRVDWILGPRAGWQAPWSEALLDPVQDFELLDQGAAAFEWSYHQHAPQLQPDGSLLLFDNGNGRAVAPDEPLLATERYSRAVQYAIDEQAGTVQQVWSYGGADQLWYSSFLGDVDGMPLTGNVLVTDGGKATGQLWARLVEVTREVDPQVVFEVELRESDSQSEIGWSVYRAERLESLYP